MTKTMQGVLSALMFLVVLPAAVFFGVRYFRQMQRDKAQAAAVIATANARATAQAQAVKLPPPSPTAQVDGVVATVNSIIDTSQSVLDFLDTNFLN